MRSCSTCCRRSSSRQMLARKDVLSDGGRCRTASNSTFARCHLSGVISMALFQLSIQPGFGTSPFPSNGCRGNTQKFRCFFDGETTKVAELNDSPLPSIQLFQSRQRLVKCQHFVRAVWRDEE